MESKQSRSQEIIYNFISMIDPNNKLGRYRLHLKMHLFYYSKTYQLVTII